MARVLIVDDEADTVRMLSAGINLFGLQSVAAHSGLQAIQQFQRERPDAVLLDLMLPDIDGYEVARRIRALPGAERVPIIVVSASPDLAAEELSLQAGATRFVPKPVNLRALAELIKRLVDEA